MLTIQRVRADAPLDLPAPAPATTRIGIDLVDVGAIERSLADFGARFTRRLFAPGELRAAGASGRLDPCVLAQRFAAKEAVIKAFDLSEAGVAWSQIEVLDDVGCGEAARVRLHGRAAEVAGAEGWEIAASLSLDGGLACAIVVALPAARRQQSTNEGRFQ